MKCIEHWKLENTGYLGTVVSFSVLFCEEPSAVVISIFDPCNTELVNDASATNESAALGRFFTYNYQSDTARPEGTYRLTLQATFGSYTYYDTFVFDLEYLNLNTK